MAGAHCVHSRDVHIFVWLIEFKLEFPALPYPFLPSFTPPSILKHTQHAWACITIYSKELGSKKVLHKKVNEEMDSPV